MGNFLTERTVDAWNTDYSVSAPQDLRPFRPRRVLPRKNRTHPRKCAARLEAEGVFDPSVLPLTAVSTSACLDAQRRLAYDVAKRVLDFFGAVCLLVLTSPVFAIVAAAIKLTDFGPVFFAQTRVGKDGRHFQCYKFRSMVRHADRLKAELLMRNRHSDQRTFKLENDPRVTWPGRIIRRWSIDELPQLWNVVRGEMSLVGPRPAVPAEVDLYSASDRRRLEVRPGLTCIWQVSGRSELPFPEQVRLDVQYIERRSVWLDLKLLFLTIPAVLSCRGAW